MFTIWWFAFILIQTLAGDELLKKACNFLIAKLESNFNQPRVFISALLPTYGARWNKGCFAHTPLVFHESRSVHKEMRKTRTVPRLCLFSTAEKEKQEEAGSNL